MSFFTGEMLGEISLPIPAHCLDIQKDMLAVGGEDTINVYKVDLEGTLQSSGTFKRQNPNNCN